jgi:hypothetical protein
MQYENSAAAETSLPNPQPKDRFYYTKAYSTTKKKARDFPANCSKFEQSFYPSS